MSEVRKDIVTRLRDTEEAAMFATPIQVEAANEIERLRKLIKDVVNNAVGGDYGEVIVEIEQFNDLEKEVSDE